MHKTFDSLLNYLCSMYFNWNFAGMKPSEVNEAISFPVVTRCISLHVCLQEWLVWAPGVSYRLQQCTGLRKTLTLLAWLV